MNHDVISHDVETPTNLDVLVGMVSKTADEHGTGWLKSLTIRCPIVTALTFDALAAHSGQSRNKLAVKALETALDLLWEQLPPIERETIEAHRSLLLTQAVREMEAGKPQESGEV